MSLKEKEETKTVSWFSAGVSSAVATKLHIDNIDEIYYIHIKDQHPDTLRFVSDCEDWFGKPVHIMQSKFKSVEDVCLGRGYVKGVAGASCTMILKKQVRKDWEKTQDRPIEYVWGLDNDEEDRSYNIIDGMPEQEHLFPLIANNIDKAEAHRILKASGIKRPTMYDLGYQNNNCVGCVKGGMSYWNKIRIDFPDVFKARAKMERIIGATCLKDKNGKVYLDELDPKRGRDKPPVVEDCGIMCELIGI